MSMAISNNDMCPPHEQNDAAQIYIFQIAHRQNTNMLKCSTRVNVLAHGLLSIMNSHVAVEAETLM